MNNITLSNMSNFAVSHKNEARQAAKWTSYGVGAVLVGKKVGEGLVALTAGAMAVVAKTIGSKTTTVESLESTSSTFYAKAKKNFVRSVVAGVGIAALGYYATQETKVVNYHTYDQQFYKNTEFDKKICLPIFEMNVQKPNFDMDITLTSGAFDHLDPIGIFETYRNFNLTKTINNFDKVSTVESKFDLADKIVKAFVQIKDLYNLQGKMV